MTVSKSLRFQVFRRDNHACRYCGRSAPEWPMRIDHVIPVALGGPDDPGNLVTSCVDCNAGKAATPADAAVVADVEQDALRWAAAMKCAAALQHVDLAEERDFADEFAEYWDSFTCGPQGSLVPREVNWRASIKAFRTAGLAGPDLEDATDVAMGATHVPASKTWRYFCGVCWRKVAERREMTAQFIAQFEAGDGPIMQRIEELRARGASADTDAGEVAP